MSTPKTPDVRGNLFPPICKLFIGKAHRSSEIACLMFMLQTVGLILSGCSKSSDSPGTGPKLPTVTTGAVSRVTTNSVYNQARVWDDGGTSISAIGICWSIDPNPTISRSNFRKSTDAVTTYFETYAIGLTANTTYYLRAFATNSAGTAYGEEVSFKTAQESATTVADIDANVYNTITIGTQVWMLENLKTLHYQNGDAIAYSFDDAAWQSRGTNAVGACSTMPSAELIYGRVYNWFAAVDPRNIAPAGWHVPTEAEWNTLINFVGGSSIAGLKLREAGTAHWLSPNAGATNSSGFTAIPAGYRLANGAYDFFGKGGWWWSVADAGNGEAKALGLFANLDAGNLVTGSKSFGTSVRCIKD